MRQMSKYLTRAAKLQFYSYNALGASRHRGLSSYPEALQHLVKSFATKEVIIVALAEFDSLKQLDKKDK